MECKILKRFGVLSTRPDGSSREVCLICWSAGSAKLDVRRIKDDAIMRIKPSSTFTRKEAELLRDILNRLDLTEIPE
jgi:hypothetical protein